MRKFILLIFLASFFACKKSEFKGFYEDGTLKEKYTYSENETIKDGLYEHYSEDGSLDEKANYKKGTLQGERNLFYSNGQVEIIEMYKDGNLDGPYQVFHENGQLQISSNYINGVLEGILKKYDETGKLMEEVTFKDNAENGPFKEYYSNGKVQWVGNYLNGDNEFGLLKQFGEDGNLIKKMMCDSLGVCQTIWTPEKGDITPEKIKLSKS